MALIKLRSRLGTDHHRALPVTPMGAGSGPWYRYWGAGEFQRGDRLSSSPPLLGLLYAVNVNLSKFTCQTSLRFPIALDGWYWIYSRRIMKKTLKRYFSAQAHQTLLLISLAFVIRKKKKNSHVNMLLITDIYQSNIKGGETEKILLPANTQRAVF